jgi:hypothetical protein
MERIKANEEDSAVRSAKASLFRPILSLAVPLKDFLCSSNETPGLFQTWSWSAALRGISVSILHNKAVVNTGVSVKVITELKCRIPA